MLANVSCYQGTWLAHGRRGGGVTGIGDTADLARASLCNSPLMALSLTASKLR